MCFVEPGEVLAKPVVSGLGEEIGVVVAAEAYPSGYVHKLWVLEGAPGGGTVLHTIDARFVRQVDSGEVRLKGPREGFHITRLAGAPPEAPGAPEAAVGLAATPAGNLSLK